MEPGRNISIITLIIFILTLSNISCSEQTLEGWIIATQVRADHANNGIPGESGFSTYEEARLVAVDPGFPEEDPVLLSAGFHSACNPSLSWDAEYLLFSGKKSASAPWQVWMMQLDTRKIIQVTGGESDCFFPVYLPDGRIAYSGTLEVNNGLKTHPVFSCNSDGSGRKQISFHPHSDRCLTVMQDGRLLVLSRQIYPDTGKAVFIAVRPDGTKAELFHQPGPDIQLAGSAYETLSGEVVFPVFRNGTPGMPYLRNLNINRPLYSGTDLTEPGALEFQSAFPAGETDVIVSARKNRQDNFGLYFMDYRTGTIPERTIYSQEYHIIEPVLAAELPRPRKLPSAVKPEELTGSVLCQDIRVSDLDAGPSEITSFSGSDGIVEFWGLDSLLGSVRSEEDGSFYVRLTADTPFRMRIINSSGNIIRGPSAWIWVRPNERRGCVGCHADRELAPENRVPLAVKKLPVTIPAWMQPE